jgi:hypothetical protein
MNNLHYLSNINSIKKIDNKNSFLNKKRNFSNFPQKKNIFLIKKISNKEEEIKKEKLEKIKKLNLFKRGSKFRGVSRNGNKWQVLIMINRKKTYIGNFDSEEEAAKVYDKMAIKYHGERARTNFYYEGFYQANSN